MEKDIGLKFKMIDEALARRANHELEEVGLTLSQANLLGILFAQVDARMTQRQLEIVLGVSHPTVVGLVKRLETKGFVETYFSAEDARMKLVHLTDKGARVIAGGGEKRRETEAWLTRGLEVREVEQLNNLLGKLLDSLKD